MIEYIEKTIIDTKTPTRPIYFHFELFLASLATFNMAKGGLACPRRPINSSAINIGVANNNTAAK